MISHVFYVTVKVVISHVLMCLLQCLLIRYIARTNGCLQIYKLGLKESFLRCLWKLKNEKFKNKIQRIICAKNTPV